MEMTDNDFAAELERHWQAGFRAAVKILEHEAKKIPLGEGNAEKGFSSTYNALMFAVEVLNKA